MIKWIIRKLPKRVVKLFNSNLNRDEYFPQVWFIWWHFCWYQDGYEHYCPFSTIHFDHAIEYVSHNWDKSSKQKISGMNIVWTSKFKD